MNVIRSIGIVAFGLALSHVSSAQSIDWDAEHAVLTGMGCKKDADAFVTQNGDDLSIVFTNLGVNLPGGGANRMLAMRTSCLSYIGATIASGHYISQLTQNISYGVTKTAHTLGSVYAQSSFFGFNVSPHGINLGYGKALNTPLSNLARQDLFNRNATPTWLQGWCARNRQTKGLFQSNIVVSGQRDNPNEDLIMFVDGFDLKFEVVAKIAGC